MKSDNKKIINLVILISLLGCGVNKKYPRIARPAPMPFNCTTNKNNIDCMNSGITWINQMSEKQKDEYIKKIDFWIAVDGTVYKKVCEEAKAEGYDKKLNSIEDYWKNQLFSNCTNKIFIKNTCITQSQFDKAFEEFQQCLGDHYIK